MKTSKIKKIKEENKLYFIIRSSIMSLTSAIIFLITVWYLVTINFIQTVFLGIFIFVLSLVISRLFELEINKGTNKILKYLNKHPRLKKLILNYLWNVWTFFFKSKFLIILSSPNSTDNNDFSHIKFFFCYSFSFFE